MSAVHIGLVATFACAALWAVLDVLRKQLAGRMDPVGLAVWLAIGQAPVLLLWALAVPGGSITAGYWPWAIASIVVNIVAAVLYLAAVGSGQFSVAIPLLAFVPVFTAVLGIPLLRQVPTGLQLLGVGAVVVGALGLHAPRPGERHGAGALLRERASLYMLGVSLCWAMTIVLDKRATAHAPLHVHALVLSVGVAAGATAWLAARGRVRELGQARLAPWRLLAAAVVAAVAMALQLRAMQDVPVAALEAVKRTLGMAAAVVFGRLLFAEPIEPRKLAAVALMAVGTVLVLGPMW